MHHDQPAPPTPAPGTLPSTEDKYPDFPGQFARTRRFSLRAPRAYRVAPDGHRVLFLRTLAGDDPRSALWLWQDGTERLLAAPP